MGKIESAQPSPWFFFQKNSAHGLGRAGLGSAQPIRSSDIDKINNSIVRSLKTKKSNYKDFNKI